MGSLSPFRKYDVFMSLFFVRGRADRVCFLVLKKKMTFHSVFHSLQLSVFDDILDFPGRLCHFIHLFREDSQYLYQLSIFVSKKSLDFPLCTLSIVPCNPSVVRVVSRRVVVKY